MELKPIITTIRTNSYKKRSTVWLHFDLDREKATAICHYCDRPINYNFRSGTTSNLLKHLHDHHPEYLDEATKERYRSREISRTQANLKPEPATMVYDSVAYELEEVTVPTLKKTFEEDDTEQVYVLDDPEGTDQQYEEEYVEDVPSDQPYQLRPSPLPPPARKRPVHVPIPNKSKSGGFIENINQRLERIERKVDLLLRYLMGDNHEFENVEEDVQQPVSKKTKVMETVLKRETEELEESSE